MKNTFIICFFCLLLIPSAFSACQLLPMPDRAPVAPPASLPIPIVYDRRDTPEHLIASYINAINRKEFQRAYAYWENKMQSYHDFVASMMDISHITLMVRLPSYIEGAAGSQYAELFTLLLITNCNGTQHVEKTCFITRRPNPDMTDTPTQWQIYSATTNSEPETDIWKLATSCSN